MHFRRSNSSTKCLMPSSQDQQEKRLNWAIQLPEPSTTTACRSLVDSPQKAHPSYPQQVAQRRQSPTFPTSATSNPGANCCPCVGCLPRFGVACLPSNWSGCLIHSGVHPGAVVAVQGPYVGAARGPDRKVPQFQRSIVGTLCRCL